MKCPQCGQWNRASIPRCMKCGCPLSQDENEQPAWRSQLKDDQTPPSYLRIDEDGLDNNAPDSRDTLAVEMQELKVRKEEGAQRQRRMRTVVAQNASRPASSAVRTHITQESFEQSGARSQRRTARAQVQQTAYVDDSRNYDPLWREAEMYGTRFQAPIREDLTGIVPARVRRLRRFLRFLMILGILALFAAAVFFGYQYYQARKAAVREENAAIVVASMENELAAHTIMIPGTDGQQIYVRELHTSYVVTGGYATIVVADHTWYDSLEDFLDETMEVTLTPFVKTASGQQKPLDVIHYTIEIPASQLRLLSPDTNRVEVASTMYAMRFEVTPGSKVYVNDEDVSDTVNSETGEFSYNATVQPIGDNIFTVRARSQYHRETSMNIVLYREAQEIPLDLAADTYTSYTQEYMKISCTTLPGASISIESPFTEIDITKLASTGAFSFYAHFDHIGYNTVKIRSSYNGLKDSVIEYQVYYVPSADVYTPKAWPLNADGYAELLSNITVRAARTQVYLVTGKLSEFVSEKPQMAIFYTGEDGKSQPVLVENYSSRTWELGKNYRIYADAYSTYNSMPWLCARYTYPE